MLPELGDGAQNGAFGHFPAQCVLESGNGRVAGLQLLVGLNRELRNLARAGQLRTAAPIAIAPQRIHVGQDPGGHDKVRLFARLSQQIEPNGNAIKLQAHQQFLGNRDMPGIGSRVPLTGYRLNE